MTTTKQQLELLKTNLERLLRSHAAIKNESAILKSQIEALRSTAADKNQTIEELQQQIKLLKTVKSLGEIAQPEEKAAIKQKINLFIKEIDQCIELLNQ